MARELRVRGMINYALRNAGIVARQQGDYETARALNEERRSIERKLGKEEGLAATLADLGITALYQGDGRRVRSFLEQGLAIARVLGHQWVLACCLEGPAGVISL